ncbi:MAG: flagellar hook-length control protein FliK [Lachnospiraceae bacterium]|nr:flagellar hook-length control protein FliK [Lachnospiraceae bacterium]
MNVAVKVQNMASANTAGRLKSLEQSVKNGDFTKMLQAKKDLADATEQSGQKQTEKPEGETVKQPSKEKTEDPKAPVKGDEDAGQQEALQQAALQQAAAQAAGLMAQEPEPDPEGLPEMLAVGGDADMPGGEMPVLQAEPETMPVRQEAAPAMAEKAPQAEAPKEKEEPEPAPVQIREIAGGEKKAENRPDSRGQEKQEDTGSSNGQRMQDTVGTSGSELYGAASFRVSGQADQPFSDVGRVSEIPLKTTPQTLPEDLGKTLAARLPDTGRTLTVELEPASLGKLTIRMTYEAGRAAVSIMATNPRTLELLNEKAAEIASILEEKTGQETVILTQQPHEQEQYQENKDGTAGRGEQEQGQRQEEKKGQHSDSFAQQLRLGLI